MISINDIFKGVVYGLWYSQHHIVHSFVLIPIGILILFTILYGFNILLADIAKINFPASVLGMLVNLIILVVLNLLANLGGTPKEGKFKQLGNVASWILKHYLMIIQPSMNFTLKWINVFFLPSFITLPLSEKITFLECAKIAAVFVVGGLLLMVFDVYLIMLLKKLLGLIGYDHSNYDKSDNGSVPEIEEGTTEESNIELFDLSKPYTRAQKDITTIDISSLRPSNTEPARKIRSSSITENPFEEADSAVIKRFATTQFPREPSPSFQMDSRSSTSSSRSDELGAASDFEIPNQKAYEEYNHMSGDSKQVAIIVSNYIDWFLYVALFFISLPFYYIRSIHVMLPFHLGLTITCYLIALLIPQKFPQTKKFAHPILISTAEILFVCFISSLIYHKGSPKGFLDDLRYYKTGKTYLHLFNGKAMYDNGETVPSSVSNTFTSQPMWPGCGDFLSSLMDISIVSLSLPMFTHRKDFVRNFWVLMPPLLISMVITFLCYPIICFKIGISHERSIGFIGRSVTLALGTPLMKSLGGSVSLMAVCTILSGICGVLIGDSFFKLLRIPSNDYVTRGVTLGINCGAIATAHLLNVDPRAASMSSLSFSVFGTVMIVLASIGAVRDFIQSLAGL